MTAPLHIVFFGSGAFGVPTLAHLARTQRVLAVVTQPDKPAGRGGKLTPTPIAQFASEHMAGVAVLKPEKCNDPAFVEQVRGLTHDATRDAWVVIAYGQYLGKKLLAERFAINLHASLLPKWRGAAPIHASVVAGDLITGNSVITLAEKMDAGLVLGQSTRAIGPTQTAGELHDLLSADGPALVDRVLLEHASGTLWPVVQDETQVTIAGKMSKADGVIDWSLPADVIRARVNGLNPWPGVTVSIATQGQAMALKLLRVAATTTRVSGEPGTLTDTSGLVVCGDGLGLQLLDVQMANKRAMAWRDFVNGVRVGQGAKFGSA
jgi:methionyl-tRNA formyltransferase